jgi:hypothetical protein
MRGFSAQLGLHILIVLSVLPENRKPLSTLVVALEAPVLVAEITLEYNSLFLECSRQITEEV